MAWRAVTASAGRRPMRGALGVAAVALVVLAAILKRTGNDVPNAVQIAGAAVGDASVGLWMAGMAAAVALVLIVASRRR